MCLPFAGGCLTSGASQGGQAASQPPAAPAAPQQPQPSTGNATTGIQQLLLTGLTSALTGAQAENTGGADLPGKLQAVATLARGFGMGSQVDAVQNSLGESFLSLLGPVGTMFQDSINAFTPPQPEQLAQGGTTAITDAFKEQAYNGLEAQLKPLMAESLQNSNALGTIGSLLTAYNSIPNAQDVSVDAPGLASQGLLNQVFQGIAATEQALRQNPDAASPLVQSLLAGVGAVAGGTDLSLDTIVAGLKEALFEGTKHATLQLAQRNGYLDNPEIRIKLPEKFQGIAGALRLVGYGEEIDTAERQMNEGAELAAGVATTVFFDAIKTMSFDDAKKILYGSDTAATEYFYLATNETLQQRYKPIIREKMDEVDFLQNYNQLVDKYKKLPFSDSYNIDIIDHATEQALGGLFVTIAKEEMKFRQDPAARTTELLQTVFGALDNR